MNEIVINGELSDDFLRFQEVENTTTISFHYRTKLFQKYLIY